jgi:YebC/PmpR family DNA-binding regulatory protein
MSGHSHASNVKRKKDVEDAKRGKIFSKLSRLISVAAKTDGDPEKNPRLKLAIDKAKQANMPKENIERAIKRGTGETQAEQMEEFIYEAYGPGGIALMVEGITDNKNRAISDIKQILNQSGAKIANKGSVQYLFEKKEQSWIPKYTIEVEDKTKKQIEQLLENLKDNGDVQEVYSNLK